MDEAFSSCTRNICTYQNNLPGQQKYYPTISEWANVKQQVNQTLEHKLLLCDGLNQARRSEGHAQPRTCWQIFSQNHFKELHFARCVSRYSICPPLTQLMEYILDGVKNDWNKIK